MNTSGGLVRDPNQQMGGADLKVRLSETEVECMKALLETDIDEDLTEEIDDELEGDPDSNRPHFLLEKETDGLNRLISAVREDIPTLAHCKDRDWTLFRFEMEFLYMMDCRRIAAPARHAYERQSIDLTITPPTFVHSKVPQPLGRFVQRFYFFLQQHDTRTGAMQGYRDGKEARDDFWRLVRLIRLAVVATK